MLKSSFSCVEMIFNFIEQSEKHVKKNREKFGTSHDFHSKF